MQAWLQAKAEQDKRKAAEAMVQQPEHHKRWSKERQVRPRERDGVETSQASSAEARKDLSAQLEGEARAATVLGPLFSAPTVKFLLPRAHRIRWFEWEQIRDILREQPRAQEELIILGQILAERARRDVSAPLDTTDDVSSVLAALPPDRRRVQVEYVAPPNGGEQSRSAVQLEYLESKPRMLNDIRHAMTVDI